MRGIRRAPSAARLLALACILALAPAATAAAPSAAARRGDLVDLSVRPAAVSLAPLPDGTGFAAAYDDRLTSNVLRFAVRDAAGWHSSFVTNVIGSRTLARDPTLAVAPGGERVVAFRADLSLDPGQVPGGTLYVARSLPGQPWQIQAIDANGFGTAVAFDHEGRIAIAYLVRLDASDAAEIRLAREVPGGWMVQPIERTTYRAATLGGASTTRVGLAFGPDDRPWIAFVDAASQSIRVVTPGVPSHRIAPAPATAAQADIAFGPEGQEAVAACGLVGDPAALWVVARPGLGGGWRRYLAAGNGATSARIVAFRGRRPVVVFRDRHGVDAAAPLRRPDPHTGRRYAVHKLLGVSGGLGSVNAGSLGAAVDGSALGIAVVGRRGLLEFASRRYAG